MKKKKTSLYVHIQIGMTVSGASGRRIRKTTNDGYHNRINVYVVSCEAEIKHIYSILARRKVRAPVFLRTYATFARIVNPFIDGHQRAQIENGNTTAVYAFFDNSLYYCCLRSRLWCLHFNFLLVFSRLVSVHLRSHCVRAYFALYRDLVIWLSAVSGNAKFSDD